MTETTTAETETTEPVENDDAAAAADKAAEEKAAAEALGDAGKQALDRMKAERNAAKADARKAAEELARMKAEAEGKQAEHAAEMSKREAEQAALAKANERILKAEVRAAAAGKLTDAADALRFIDLTSLDVGDDGEVDSAAITQAIDDLITAKPYLAAQSGKKFQGGADQGTRKDAGKPQLTEADVKKLASEGKHAEIEQARSEGRLNDLLGIK